MDDRSQLIEKIYAAFPSRCLDSAGIAVWEDFNGEDEEIRDQLAGRAWDSVADSEIGQIPVCLLTDEAKSILLPAIMIGVLRSGYTNFRVGELLLDPRVENLPCIEGVARLLNASQLSVVGDYLDFACSNGDREGCSAALFWRQRSLE